MAGRRTLGATMLASALLVAAFAGPGIETAETQVKSSSRYGPMPATWEGVFSVVSGYRQGLLSEAKRYGLDPVNSDPWALATARLRPWARELMHSTDINTTIDDLGAICGPAGLFRHPPSVAGYMLLQIPGQVIMVSQAIDQVGVRRIYLTDRHPNSIRPTWNGDSIGHWEGDTLVIDTVGFNDLSWLGTDLQPHSEALHTVERIRLVKDGRYLEINTTVDDRKALTTPYSYSRYYRRVDQTFESTALPCNADIGEQAEWVSFRDQAIQDYETAVHTAPGASTAPIPPTALMPATPPPTTTAPPPPSTHDLPGANPTLAPFDGVYDVIPDDAQAAGGGTNRGSPDQIQPTIAGRVPVDKRASDLDPYGLCEPIGPFRMMAQPDLRIQLVAGSNRLVILFQDILHGYLRSLYLNGQHPANYRAKYAWQGDSVAHWQGDTLVVDTIGFNDRTWLNQHTKASNALHLVERIRPIDGGNYLAYQLTATDPKSLKAPYSYTRYFRRVNRRIEQKICTPHTSWTLDDGP